MEAIFEFKGLRFSQALIEIRKSHPYTEEITAVDREDEVIEWIGRLEKMTEPQVRKYAGTIRNSELDLIFHVLKKDLRNSLKDKLFIILTLRIKKRFFVYNWIMIQDHYEKRGLVEAYALMKSFMEKNYPADYNQSLLSRIDLSEGDLIHKATIVLNEDGGSLTDFIHRYCIRQDSRFAMDLTLSFLEQCGKDAFNVNKEVFRQFVKRQDINPLPMIYNYMRIFNVLEYTDDINEDIIALYGAPKDNHVFWDELEKSLKEKYIEWMQTHELRVYFGNNYPKFSFWCQYFEQVEIRHFEDVGILIIKLPGDYVVVDFLDEPKISYLYKKKYFEQTMHRYQEERELGNVAWPIQREDVIFIRDAQLNGISANVFHIVYEGVGRLYTMEIIEDNMIV